MVELIKKKRPKWIAKNPSVWDELFEIMHTVEQIYGEPFMIENTLSYCVEQVQGWLRGRHIFIITQMVRPP